MIDIAVGDELPPLTVEPISRTALALFAGASGDHNPIHIDVDVARSVGLDDVFAHGMLSMAYLGRLLTGWVPQERLRSWQPAAGPWRSLVTSPRRASPGGSPRPPWTASAASTSSSTKPT